MKKYAIHKIGGAGLMLPLQKLLELVNYILKEDKGKQTIFVISAFAGVTRILQDIFEAKLQNNESKVKSCFTLLKKIYFDREEDLMEDTFYDIPETGNWWERIQTISFKTTTDTVKRCGTTIKAELLSCGEFMSSEIFTGFLEKHTNTSVKFLRPWDIIMAKGDDYCNSTVKQPKTAKNISRVIAPRHSVDKIMIFPGYIASDEDRFDRLLGFDGSDLTAGLISHGLQTYDSLCSTELNFWKDVDGVYDTEGVYKSNISYKEYLDLPTTPVRKDAIIQVCEYKSETRIRSFLNLDHQGTKITW